MKEKAEKKDVYLNPIAILFLMAPQTHKVLIAGRGFGKSFVMGVSIMQKVQTLPKSRGLLVGPSYTQILTNILSPMKTAWSLYGYEEGIDYVIGKRPPKHFDQPYAPPDKYENVLSWWNGTICMFGSMDRPDLLRGGSNDWSLADEVLKYNRDKYEQIIAYTIRGSSLILENMPGHLRQEMYSSMPYGMIGSWLLDKKVEAENPENDLFYIEGTSWHNRKILKDKVLKMWWRNSRSNPSKYLIEVMNKRISQFGNTFYPALKERHWYSDTFNYRFIDTLGTDPEKLKQDCRWDKDYDPKRPLNISHDFGAFNCIQVDQEWDLDPMFGEHETVRVLNYMYVSHPRILMDLANDFCDYYQYAENKTVYQWGDKSGNKNEANSRLSYFEDFAAILEKRGWRVIRCEIGDAGHLARHKFIIDLHQEQDPRLPVVRYNTNNCKDLRIALESTPMVADKKDKSSERNRLMKQEHATHGTDAHDYRFWWGFRSRVQERSYSTPVSFGG